MDEALERPLADLAQVLQAADELALGASTVVDG
jgi:hypothetical protein